MKNKLVTQFGLSEQDADILVSLLKKVQYQQKDADYVNSQLESDFPFEGGVSSGEALIMLCEIIKEESKARIFFDKEESDERTDNGWNWFYGKLRIDGKVFPFSLCEMNTDVGGQNTTATEITWVEGTPENSKQIETEIENRFEEEFPNE